MMRVISVYMIIHVIMIVDTAITINSIYTSCSFKLAKEKCSRKYTHALMRHYEKNISCQYYPPKENAMHQSVKP
jgi:hypothetical protein